MQTETKEFWKLFKAGACSIDVKANEQEAIFEELVGNLVKAKLLPEELRKKAVRTLVDREKLASTGVGMNVAIPHVVLEGIDKAIVSLSIHHGGVQWSALDGEPVHLFFTVLRPDGAGDQHDPDRHLGMMKWISGLGRDGDFRRFAMNCPNRTELVALLREKSGE